jgi:glycosyltransferase involved in cell wall biosynthesis
MMARRPRILFVAPITPYPLDEGWKQRMFHTLQGLATMGPVTLACYAPQGADPAMEHLAPLKNLCDSLQILDYPTADSPPPVRSYRDVLERFILSRRPFTIADFPGAPLAEHVAELVNEADLVWVARLIVAEWIPQGRHKMIVDLDDLEHVKGSRSLALKPSGPWKLALRFDNYKLRRLERSAPARYGKVVLTSEYDRRVFPRRLAEQTLVIPNAISSHLLAAPLADPQTHSMVFVGDMGYSANVDAAFWFTREILPRVVEALPDARLLLVGKDDRGHLRPLHDGKTVTATGRVDDVAPYVAGAAVSIAPIRVAGGTRIKILESLALGTPVVATTIGAEGLDLVPGRHIKIGDTPEAFADAVIQVLTDRGLRRTMAAAGRAVVAERYTWDRVGRRLVQDVGEWLDRRGRR